MEQTKTCSACGLKKPLSEFNKKRNNKDGLQERCKSCFSAYNKARYAADPERHKANTRKYRKHNLDNVFQTRMKMCEKNPNHKNAHEAVLLALKLGYISRPSYCSGCGCSDSEHRIEAHHYDYSKPLDVIWVCTPCHSQLDAKRRIYEGKKPYGRSKSNAQTAHD